MYDNEEKMEEDPVGEEMEDENEEPDTSKTDKLPAKFFRGDRQHSKYKRLILRNMLRGVFPYYWKTERRELYHGHDENTANLYYLDGFSGQGKYRDEDLIQDPEDDITIYGSPIIAVNEAIQALDYKRNEDEEKFNSIFKPHKYAVHFFFNEMDSDNLHVLKRLVRDRFLLHKWRLEEEDGESFVFRGEVGEDIVVEDDGFWPSLKVREARMKVTYFNRPFHKLPFQNFPSPLFSFVDPFGIKEIPMQAVRQLIGVDRDVFVNLMVKTINRNRNRLSTPGSAVYELYQGSDVLSPDSIPSALIPSPDKTLDQMADLYFKRLGEEFEKIEGLDVWKDGYMHTKLKVNMATSAPDKGTLYYLGLASCNLLRIQQAKQAMMNATDLPNELVFSYYHRTQGNQVEYKRKSDDATEAKHIWEKFSGRRITLGKLKKKIILETAYVYHVKALKVLEDEMKIVHVDSRAEERRMGTFCSDISIQSDSKDRVKDGKEIRYGNNWVVHFTSEDTFQKASSFLDLLTDPPQTNLGIDSLGFKELLCQKIKVMGTFTRDELFEKLPPGKRKALGKKTINFLLEEMVNSGMVGIVGEQKKKFLDNVFCANYQKGNKNKPPLSDLG